MKFQSKTSILKNGYVVKIRMPEISEAKRLLTLKRAYIKDTTTIPMVLAEYPMDIEREAELISKYREQQNSLLLIAEADDEFIGNIDLTGSERSKMAHTGMIGMGIKEAWRNQGLGKQLMTAVLEWAKQHEVLELIWLDVYASNQLGYHLYKKSGFEVSGVIKGFFKDGDEYKDKIQMYQRVK